MRSTDRLRSALAVLAVTVLGLGAAACENTAGGLVEDAEQNLDAVEQEIEEGDGEG